MKVLMLNGSPHAKGNTSIALDEMRKILSRRALRQKKSWWEIKTSGDVLPVAAVMKKGNAYLTIL